MRKNPVFAFILFTAVFLAAGCQQPSTSGKEPSDNTESSARAAFYTANFVGTWVNDVNMEITFTNSSYTYLNKNNGQTSDCSISPSAAIFTQSEFDNAPAYDYDTNPDGYNKGINSSYSRDFSDNDYTQHGYLLVFTNTLCSYSFSDSGNTLTFGNGSYSVYTKKTSGGSDSGSVSSDFDITSGSWNYNPAVSSGGYLTFTSGGNVTFTPKTSTSSNNYSGTYTLSGTTLTLVMENTADTTSFTDKFTVTATSSSLGLSLQTSEYTIQGNSGSSTDSSTAITALWGTGQNSSMTEITLANQ